MWQGHVSRTGPERLLDLFHFHLVQALEQYHPMGLTEDWADKMAGQAFNSKNQRTTFEHYMQVCFAMMFIGHKTCLLYMPVCLSRRLDAACLLVLHIFSL